MMNTKSIKTLLSKVKNIAVVTHFNPDGDAVGSSLALAQLLIKKGHKVSVIIPNDYPDFLNWIPGQELIANFEKNPKKTTRLMEAAELIFCLDFNALHRIQELGKLVAKSKAVKILIDHHLEPESFPDYVLHNVKASSTAELVYEFIDLLGEKELIDNDIAAGLYTGLLTDTGSFQYASTTPKVHRIVADLMEIGLDTFYVYDRIFNQSELGRIQFFGFSWLERMEILESIGAGIIAINQEDQKKYSLKKGDTEGLVNTPLQIKNIDIAVLAAEQDGYVKLSFRSKGDINVNALARKYFNGGGHKNAAGGIYNTTLVETVNKLKEVLPELKS